MGCEFATAEIAQLVERVLAKDEATSSTLVFRSTISLRVCPRIALVRRWECVRLARAGCSGGPGALGLLRADTAEVNIFALVTQLARVPAFNR